MAANGGPTNAAAQAAPGMAPGFDQNALIRGLTQADPMAAAQLLQPKPADYKVVGDALLQVGPGVVKEAYRAPAKPEAMPSAVREYEYARQQGYQGTFQQFKLEQQRAGASSTSVSSGYGGYGGGGGGRGGYAPRATYGWIDNWYEPKAYLPKETRVYKAPTPSVFTNANIQASNPTVRRLQRRRERVQSQRGRLKPWQ